MEKCVTGIYLTVLFIGIIYVVFAALSLKNHIVGRTKDTGAVLWKDQIEESWENGVYYYRRILPLEPMDEKVIVYNTVHMELQVFIDGEEVYAIRREPVLLWIKLMKNCWCWSERYRS